jgi:hypothetical protein
MRHKIIKLSFSAIALGCIAFFIIGMAPADAKPWGFQNIGLHGKVGTWHGVAADLGITWMAVNTPGQNAFNGQMTVEWIEIDPTLFGNFSEAARVTNAVGVWKQVGWRVYPFNWIGYGLDEAGVVVYTARASGEAYLVDCDRLDITYVLEVWPAGYDISTDTPPICIPGTAVETRMLLVEASCED